MGDISYHSTLLGFLSAKDLALLQITVFWSPNFHELWRSVMNICLLRQGKRQWATLVLGWVTSCGMCLSWNFFVSPDFRKF